MSNRMQRTLIFHACVILIQVGKGFMDKLEQVSENPDLKQEMEAEVASTNSNQVFYLSMEIH